MCVCAPRLSTDAVLTGGLCGGRFTDLKSDNIKSKPPAQQFNIQPVKTGTDSQVQSSTYPDGDLGDLGPGGGPGGLLVW